MEDLKKMLEQLKEVEKAVDVITPKLEKLLNLTKEMAATGVKMTGQQLNK